ncbi:methyltransferase-like protein isoform X2 [Oratosquilla oratoria]|uniref:methyltransferase-like protein isoform X2 n=1 Tax=Oratosquilla oratoria TaxID=337810 RepID=UPI003F766898
MAQSSDVSEKRPQFGARFLEDKSEVFRHNAWDNVEWDEEQENHAKEMVARNSDIIMTNEDILKLEEEAGSQWDAFYGIHQNKFFKDRHWLFTEFPELAPQVADKFPVKVKPDGTPQNETSPVILDRSHCTELNAENTEKYSETFPGSKSKFRILEVGCGVGNTIFPILETNNSPDLFVYGCDFSPVAIDIVKQSPDYNHERCHAFVCDVTKEDWGCVFPEESLDIIVCIFVLSAIDPERLSHVVEKMALYLKPGGKLLFRDYGRYDLAQLRFKKGRCLRENFYARGDGTRCYFFTQEEVRTLMTKAGLEEEQNLVDRRLQVNRGKQIKMYRVWIQAKYRKPVT